ncbi:MAG: hypothetical protein WCE79_15420 [Xanthobacteraceae bacterium]
MGDREEVAKYIADMSAELARMAREAGHETLAYVLLMAVGEANIASLGPAAGPRALD